MVRFSSVWGEHWSKIKASALIMLSALVIICIILAAGLVSTISNYALIINQNNDTIASLNSQITSKDTTISSLNSQMDALNRIVNLANFTVWAHAVITQNRTSYSSWNFSANYAGYLYVDIYISTPTTWVRVLWSSRGVNYDNQITVGGPQGEAAFPVLPSSNIEVRVGNLDYFSMAEHVTIVYVF